MNTPVYNTVEKILQSNPGLLEILESYSEVISVYKDIQATFLNNGEADIATSAKEIVLFNSPTLNKAGYIKS